MIITRVEAAKLSKEYACLASSMLPGSILHLAVPFFGAHQRHLVASHSHADAAVHIQRWTRPDQ